MHKNVYKYNNWPYYVNIFIDININYVYYHSYCYYIILLFTHEKDSAIIIAKFNYIPYSDTI